MSPKTIILPCGRINVKRRRNAVLLVSTSKHPSQDVRFRLARTSRTRKIVPVNESCPYPSRYPAEYHKTKIIVWICSRK